MPLGPGQTLLHYRLVEKLGEGGMGVVWKAVDTTLDREVAVKVLPETVAAEADRISRFEREAKAIAALNHPNIITVFSIEKCDGIPFITMELVEGESLEGLIRAACRRRFPRLAGAFAPAGGEDSAARRLSARCWRWGSSRRKAPRSRSGRSRSESGRSTP